jgi:hypothetical protein
MTKNEEHAIEIAEKLGLQYLVNAGVIGKNRAMSEIYGGTVWSVNDHKARKYLARVLPKWGLRRVTPAAIELALEVLDDRVDRLSR